GVKGPQLAGHYLLKCPLFDAKAAVTLFFVLSGYVLTLSIRREPVSFRGYANFGIRRVLRLYPMHFAATLLAMAVLFWVRKNGGFLQGLPEGMDPGFLHTSGNQTTQWLRQLTLVMPGMDSNFANPPVWTLMTEAKVAIVFPFIAWGVLRLPPWFGIAMVSLLVLGSDWLDHHTVGTVALLGQFGLGALIARLPADTFAPFGRWKWITWSLISLVLYSAVHFRYSVPNVWIAYYLGSFGAAGIIIASIKWDSLNQKLTALQRFFRADISYGLYILHFPIMLCLRKWSGETITSLSGPLLFAASVLLTIGLSVALMFVAERPAIELGKRLTGKRPTPAP
ncbi:MAG: acyltransferase, partial [Verrucomicrobiae bacterium]|nr:acyltransferase [Verrucomicrobiae bacterium]